jgi:hypothetical protein
MYSETTREGMDILEKDWRLIKSRTEFQASETGRRNIF